MSKFAAFSWPAWPARNRKRRRHCSAQALLAAAREEQRAVYQSPQQAELQNTDPVCVLQGQIPHYDDVARARQKQQARPRNYASKLQQRHARYRDLGAEAARFLERLRALSMRPSLPLR